MFRNKWNSNRTRTPDNVPVDNVTALWKHGNHSSQAGSVTSFHRRRGLYYLLDWWMYSCDREHRQISSTSINWIDVFLFFRRRLYWFCAGVEYKNLDVFYLNMISREQYCNFLCYSMNLSLLLILRQINRILNAPNKLANSLRFSLR